METDASVDLDSLSTEELRQRAFALAAKHRDLGFFWSVLKHLPHATDDAENIEADLGAIGGTISDAIGVWREFTGREGYGNSEPLLRAAFTDYLLRTEGGTEGGAGGADGGPEAGSKADADADQPAEPAARSDVEH